MKRPISHFLVPVFCVLMLPFCIPGSALGVEKTRGHVAGKFQMEIGNNDAGWVQSVEGGTASSDTVQEKLGPVPKQTTVAPQHRNLQPVQTQTPTFAVPCTHPPCGLRKQKPANNKNPAAQREALGDRKDSISEMNEQDQMQLQQSMERKNETEEMISNTMKKSSETQDSVTGNLKD
ncbi:MAG: hypothetical protein ACAH80_06995 [Alphaproteobacteria bacterium]